MTDKVEQSLNNFEQHVKDNVTNTAGELLINTNLETPNKFQIGPSSIGIVIGFSEDELKLDYKIKAPATNKFIITNSYRDLRLVGQFKEVEISQYSGDLVADYLDRAILNMKYGRASLKGVEKATIDIYEQKLSIEKLGETNMEAKYSDLRFMEARKIIANAYESDFYLGTLQYLSGSYKYGEIEIAERLKEGSELEFYEMELEGKNIDKLQFKSSKYSKLTADNIDYLSYILSYEDDTQIEMLGQLISGNSKYGKHSIKTLQNKLDLNSYEDDIEVEVVSNSVNEISINGKYIDAKLGLTNTSFVINGNVKYGKIDYDETNIEIKKYIKDGDQLEIEAFSKNKKENPLLINIQGYEVKVELN